jgi:hypothetical protein
MRREYLLDKPKGVVDVTAPEELIGSTPMQHFAPLARLHRFKRDPALAADPEALAAFAEDAEAFPPGVVRAESRMLVATAWLGPLHRPRDAIPLFRLVAIDLTADGSQVRFAERGFVDALIAHGQLDEAAGEANVHAIQLEPEVVTRLQKLLCRRTLLRAAELQLASFVAVALVANGVRAPQTGSPSEGPCDRLGVRCASSYALGRRERRCRRIRTGRDLRSEPPRPLRPLSAT